MACNCPSVLVSDKLQIEICHQEGCVYIAADGIAVRKVCGRTFDIFHHQVAAHAKHRILIQIRIIIRENFGDQWAKPGGLDDVVQMRWTPRMAAGCIQNLADRPVCWHRIADRPDRGKPVLPVRTSGLKPMK